MHKTVRNALFVIVLGASCLNAPSARAAAIVNLADVPMTVEIEQAGGFTPLEIAPGRRFYVPGKARFRYKERVLFIEQHEEYALWPDGSFGPQRRMRSLLGL